MRDPDTPYVWHFFGTMPSTNVRISASVMAMLGTTFVVLLSAMIVTIRGSGKSWSPPEIWLGFLVIWGGLDLGQFMGKRTTSSEYVAAKQSGEPPKEPLPKPPEIGA